MPQPMAIEIVIASKEGGIMKRVQQRDYFVLVFHPEPPDLNADLPDTYSPTFKVTLLSLTNVFVEYVHAA